MKNLKKNKGITLIALVITIIVLLILAGVSLSMVFSQDGIFSRAENAGNKYNEAKAREVLETVLAADAQYEKYSNPLYDEDEFLDILIENEIQGAQVVDDNVILGGYIFELDRSVPKIGKGSKKADGIIITARVSGNKGWHKEPNVTITGKILTYSGGRITTVSAKKGENPISNFKINESDGCYTISNITEDTTIVINAADSNNKTAEREIPISIKVDSTAPTVLTLDAKAEGLKIIFSATGHDKNSEGQEESGIDYFNYKITSTEDTTLEGIPEKQRTGIFKQGETVTIKTTATGNRDETKYQIEVTATDNVGNTTVNAITKEVTTIDGITIAEAKRLVNESTLRDYLGTRVIDYNPPAGGTWRIYYYDEGNSEYPNGYFGDGSGSIYLKRDYDEGLSTFKMSDFKNHIASDNKVIMAKLNPAWRDKVNNTWNDENSWVNATGYMCDPEVWNSFCDSNTAKYAIRSSEP